MIHKVKPSFDRDADGNKYKHPERSCKECSKYPCFDGLQQMVENEHFEFAKYGCRMYEHQ